MALALSCLAFGGDTHSAGYIYEEISAVAGFLVSERAFEELLRRITGTSPYRLFPDCFHVRNRTCLERLRELRCSEGKMTIYVEGGLSGWSAEYRCRVVPRSAEREGITYRTSVEGRKGSRIRLTLSFNAERRELRVSGTVEREGVWTTTYRDLRFRLTGRGLEVSGGISVSFSGASGEKGCRSVTAHVETPEPVPLGSDLRPDLSRGPTLLVNSRRVPLHRSRCVLYRSFADVLLQ